MPVPTCRPQRPSLQSPAERIVWDLLSQQLGADVLLLSGLRVTDRGKDHEADVVVALPEHGIVVVEVKGGLITCADGSWRQGRDQHRIDPVDQARSTKYAIRTYVEADPRWRDSSRRRIRWSHAVCFPQTELSPDFAMPDCPRWTALDRTQLADLVTPLVELVDRQETSNAAPDVETVELVAEILLGRGLPQRDLVAGALERAATAERLTQEQAVVLGAIRLLPRVEVRGGAGSGKTWLALEQARRLSADGLRVALLCYSRGLAAYLQRHVAGWKRQHRPAYVGTFHALGSTWGARGGDDDDPDYWERLLPEQMRGLAEQLPPSRRFDAIVVDEAQDFADLWWPALLSSLRDESTGRVYVFSDEGQRIFSRYGEPPVPLVPIVLDHNLRNTKQIATVFGPLAPMRMRLLGGDGPATRFVACAAGDALTVADEQVDQVLEEGWRPADVALLATGSRHPEQAARQAVGQDSYWDSFWDEKQVFYGHVLGFKGLERSAVVLAVNDDGTGDRARERLYVGLSRARDQLVVCADPAQIATVAGSVVSRLLLDRAAPGRNPAAG